MATVSESRGVENKGVSLFPFRKHLCIVALNSQFFGEIFMSNLAVALLQSAALNIFILFMSLYSFERVVRIEHERLLSENAWYSSYPSRLQKLGVMLGQMKIPNRMVIAFSGYMSFQCSRWLGRTVEIFFVNMGWLTL